MGGGQEVAVPAYRWTNRETSAVHVRAPSKARRLGSGQDNLGEGVDGRRERPYTRGEIPQGG